MGKRCCPRERGNRLRALGARPQSWLLIMPLLRTISLCWMCAALLSFMRSTRLYPLFCSRDLPYEHVVAFQTLMSGQFNGNWVALMNTPLISIALMNMPLISATPEPDSAMGVTVRCDVLGPPEIKALQSTPIYRYAPCTPNPQP